MLPKLIVFASIFLLLFTLQGKEFLAIWPHWFVADEPISQCNLLGRKVYWWGRLGKLLEMIGALFILCDIFGTKKSLTSFRNTKSGQKNSSMLLLMRLKQQIKT